MNLLSIQTHSYKGRCFFLNESVPAGTLLHVASPASIIPDSESKRRLCASCLQWKHSDHDSASFLHHSCFSIYSNVKAIPGSREVSQNGIALSNLIKQTYFSVPPLENHLLQLDSKIVASDLLVIMSFTARWTVPKQTG